MRIKRWLKLVFAFVGCLGAWAALWYAGGWNPVADTFTTTPEVDPRGRASPSLPIPSVHFSDWTARAGISFHHTNGSFGKKLLPETMGSGVAVLDYDGDGRQDILFVNSCYWPGFEGKDRPTLKLYRNLGQGKFEDVTEAAGLAVTFYGMGVTIGDYDNDGWPDVFISGVGGNHLFRNVPDGKAGRRFEDVTASAGVGGAHPWPSVSGEAFLQLRTPIGFPSSAAFLDYDGDGLLDLFVCNYVSWSPGSDLRRPCQLRGLERAFCSPSAFEGTQCTLYRNLGNGRFEDVSKRAGIEVSEREEIGLTARTHSVGKALGVFVADLDGDGWPDIMVANDTVRNFLFHNKGDGTFEEIGLLSGVALVDGNARGGMGIDGALYRPGCFGVLVANLNGEPCTFLRLDQPERLLFSDMAYAEGLTGTSRPPLKFGTFFFDYDLDGRLDLLICNGHLEPDIHSAQASQSYAQPVLLYWNSGGPPSFLLVNEQQASSDLFRPLVGRGCAFADFDCDGYPDVVLTANGGPARLLHNDGGSGNNWIRLVLEGDGVRCNRSAIGAKVTLKASGLVQYREVTSARGYLSQSELPLTFGLGKTQSVDSIIVEWPGKRPGRQVLTDLAVNRVHHIKQPGG